MHEASVGIFRNFSRVVVKTDPCRCHDIGVDIVKEVINLQILHLQVQALVELLLDEFQIFGEEEHALSWGE